ncbi:hypothetical protein F4782DRAFT_493398 [Xylaria castorea]|nr:hypothetical protein F4782DRAFT_493398 [Xylaria castorea]
MSMSVSVVLSLFSSSVNLKGNCLGASSALAKSRSTGGEGNWNSSSAVLPALLMSTGCESNPGPPRSCAVVR